MKKKSDNKKFLKPVSGTVFLLILFGALYFIFGTDVMSVKYYAMATSTADSVNSSSTVLSLVVRPPLDKALYDRKMEELANNIKVIAGVSVSSSTATLTTHATSTPPKKNLWPAKTVYPNDGAILPFNRIVAYYGNFYSTKMGVLGEYPEATVIQKLSKEVERWTLADPGTPAIPAIHYIVTTAQGSPGGDGLYRLRMPSDQIKKAIALADKMHGLVFLDIQVGLSNLQAEVPVLKEYLKLPNVHLGVDPEFSMKKSGKKPGTVIGTTDASEINFAINYLAQIVKENNLPPKILVVHRFTDPMVTNAAAIKPMPEVQVVMDMDGWGSTARKKKAYIDVVYDEPVQFTGLKLFYKNDIKPPSTGMLSIAEILKFKPIPVYIQYQ